MASYLLSFNAFGDDIASSAWRIIPLDPSDSTYCVPANGHRLIDISGSDYLKNNLITIQVAWVDCDANKANAIVGVSKIISIDMESGERMTGLNNITGRYVYNTIATTILPTRTLGIGPMIDTRPLPKKMTRALLVGLTYEESASPDVQLIVTPSKII